MKILPISISCISALSLPIGLSSILIKLNQDTYITNISTIRNAIYNSEQSYVVTDAKNFLKAIRTFDFYQKHGYWFRWKNPNLSPLLS